MNSSIDIQKLQRKYVNKLTDLRSGHILQHPRTLLLLRVRAPGSRVCRKPLRHRKSVSGQYPRHVRQDRL